MNKKTKNLKNDENCNHDPNLKDTSLKRINKRVMVHPERADFFCPICKKAFRFGINIVNDKKVFIPDFPKESGLVPDFPREVEVSENVDSIMTKTRAKEDA